MVRIINIGMNHETAPIELRECLAEDTENSGTALIRMQESTDIKEGMFLSTCNRIESIYTTKDPNKAKKSMISILSEIGGIAENDLISHLYINEDMEAVRHIFRVASSLDSMVLGEPQILGQVKEAYHQAASIRKTTGVVLNRLMHRSFHVAKRVRTETGIAESAVSISYAAVELAKKRFKDLNGCKVLLVGAGEMAELAARHLINSGIKSILVVNRNFDRAVRLANNFHGKPVRFEQIGSRLSEVDIVITSTASAAYIIRYDTLKNMLDKRKNRPLFIIDIAVPRDVEPDVGKLRNVFLYDIDDLKGVIKDNTAQRKKEALKAEKIIEEEVNKFGKWIQTLEIVPTIVSLKDKIEKIRRTELARSVAGLENISKSQLKAIETLTISLAEKIINDPIIAMKKVAERSSRDVYLDVTRQLFNLDQEKNNEK